MKTIYRTSDPVVLEYTEAQRLARIAWGVKMEEFIAAHLPAGTTAAVNTGWGSHHLAGFRLPEGASRVAGLVKGDYDVRYVNERSAAGKVLGLELDPLKDIPHPMLGMPGMPRVVMVENTVFTHGSALVDGVVWTKWGFDIEAAADAQDAAEAAAVARGGHVSNNVERPDAAIWSPVPLSEYYTLVEAGNDPFAKVPVGV